MNDIAVRVDHVTKTFKLPHEKQSSLKGALINFGKRGYENQVALDNVSFEVKKGEFFGIVGRNGSGKSTLLKLISGIYSPDSGEITVNGKLVPFIELGVGFNPELSGRANVYLNGALLGFSRKEMAAMYDEIVEFAELERFMDQKLKNYSSGMQVRLAFSIAIRADSDILVLDEVLAVGDEAFQRKCNQYFAKLRKDKRTVILVTHSMDAVREYCDRAILVDNGGIVKAGDVSKVADEYSKLFLGEVANEVVAEESPERWGTGEVKVTDMKVDVTEKALVVDTTVKAAKDVESIMVGVRFSMLDGTLVAGMSTRRMMEGGKLAIKKGKLLHLRFTIPNNLGKKDIEVGTVVMSGDSTITFDHWNTAARIENPNRESYYPIVYDEKVEIVGR